MKNVNILFMSMLAGVFAFSSCSKWTDVEKIDIETDKITNQLRERDLKKWAEEKKLQNDENKATEQWNKDVAVMYDRYWESVRKYKESDHEIVYGWYAGWSATEGMPRSFLSNLPDSVEMVSLWGGTAPYEENSDKWKDLKYAQKTKGLKVLLCWQNSSVGLGLPGGRDAIYKKVENMKEEESLKLYGRPNLSREQRAIVEYAQELTRFIEKHGLDGYDIDYEPYVGDHGGGFHEFTPSSNPNWVNNMKLFIEEMGKMYGPKSGRKGKILIIDGELNTMNKHFPDMGEYMDYFISQAYYNSNPSSLQSRYSECLGIKGFTSEKFIVADEFEKNGGWTTGGGSSADAVKNGTTHAERKAAWKPTGSKRKGGWAAYHIELEYPANYKYVRKVIQIQNPTKYRP
ncbi:glycoside hydrolase family 18 [Porphyromonas pogonae]|uniref:glycoside hydrolase family 18 n=1 Tax=Porphyromonas pogonae TaxID=867595 RepID=UPI002E7A1AB3|nr:glycoside hydrolase family 18 [Porphyromonas pogonae]